MRKRRLAIVLLALLPVACGDDDTDVATDDAVATTTTSTTEATTTTSVPATEVSILVTTGHEVSRVVDGRVEHVGVVSDLPEVAFGDGHGTVVVEDDGRLAVMVDGQPETIELDRPGRPMLFDLTVIDGVCHVLYGARLDPENDEPSGQVVLRNLDTGEERELGTGYAPEYHTNRGSIVGDLVVTSAYADLTETVEWRPLGDDPVPGWTPTDDLPYNMPPLISDAVLGPDGLTLAWLSGPDWSGETNEENVGTWEVVVADLEGNERHRIPIDVVPGAIPVRLDYDGTNLLVSRKINDDDDAPAVLIELDDVAESVTLSDLPIAGVATFET